MQAYCWEDSASLHIQLRIKHQQQLHAGIACNMSVVTYMHMHILAMGHTSFAIVLLWLQLHCEHR